MEMFAKTKEKIGIQVGCHMCGKTHTLHVYPEDLERWEKGEVIQNAMPYLRPEERELLISGICGRCFENLFGVW